MQKFHLREFFTIGVIAAIFLSGCADKKEGPIQAKTRFIMDTLCTIQVPGGVEVLPAIDTAFDRMEEVDRKFNALNPESPLYGFNEDNKPVEDEEIIALVEKALEICEKSEGKFDITIFPLVELWGFYSESPSLPSQESIDELLVTTGYQHLSVEDGRLVKDNADIRIDLGSIAKGYAIGEAAEALKQVGIKSGLIDAGGDIYALGDNQGQPWKIGIRNPRGEGVIGVLELSDMSVVTSGDYERFFEEDGVKYHHILDPSTGYPARGLVSTTVISSDPALADAYSTAIFVLGRDKGVKLSDSLPSLQTFLITDDGERIHSSSIEVEIETIN